MAPSPTTKWTDLVFGLTMEAGDWLAIWATFLGVLVAFLLGIAAQRRIKAIEERAASEFLRRQFDICKESLKVFDSDTPPLSADDLVYGKALGALAQANACFRWAAAHPALFSDLVYLRILMFEDDVFTATDINILDLQDANGKLDRVSAAHELRKRGHLVLNRIANVQNAF